MEKIEKKELTDHSIDAILATPPKPEECKSIMVYTDTSSDNELKTSRIYLARTRSGILLCPMGLFEARAGHKYLRIRCQTVTRKVWVRALDNVMIDELSLPSLEKLYVVTII